MNGFKSVRVYISVEQHAAVTALKGRKSWEVVVGEALYGWLRAAGHKPHRTWLEEVEADIAAEFIVEPVGIQLGPDPDTGLQELPGSEGVAPSGAV